MLFSLSEKHLRRETTSERPDDVQMRKRNTTLSQTEVNEIGIRIFIKSTTFFKEMKNKKQMFLRHKENTIEKTRYTEISSIAHPSFVFYQKVICKSSQTALNVLVQFY